MNSSQPGFLSFVAMSGYNPTASYPSDIKDSCLVG